MNTLNQIVARLRAREPELRALGIRTLSIFGSTARGEARPDSDIDIGVVLDPDARLGLKFFALEERLGEWLGRPVQLLTEPTGNRRLQDNLDRDRHLVF